jgi:glycosyltransferase involved in cell wall biosynthesis
MTMGYLGNVLTLLPDYHEFDAIITHGDSLLAPIIGKPVLRVLHGSALGEARSATSVGRCVLQVGVYVQELLTACTQRGVVAVSANTTRDNPFVGNVIPHGVDERVFTPWPGTKTPEPSLLFVGALEGRKRGRFLLDIFLSQIQPKCPSASLTIVGPQGPSHPSVAYVTGVDDEELAALYRRSWIYVSPSTYEGFGLPYLEAMACGTPVIASRAASIPEVLGDAGILLDPDDVTGWGSAIDSVLTDPTRRERMRAAGIQRAGGFTWARTARLTLDAYRRAVESRASVVDHSRV